MIRAGCLATAFLFAVTSLHAQWPPRALTEINLEARAPRTTDGRPDLSGVWRAGGGSYSGGQRTGFSSPGPDVFSVGRWDGDVLVVETTNFRDGGWLDAVGNPLTDAATVTERFRRPSYGRMEIDITIDDPKAYTKPWTVRHNQVFMPDQEIIEFICEENQRFGAQPGLGPAAGTKKK